jgi:hypothetical protein
MRTEQSRNYESQGFKKKNAVYVQDFKQKRSKSCMSPCGQVPFNADTHGYRCPIFSVYGAFPLRTEKSGAYAP